MADGSGDSDGAPPGLPGYRNAPPGAPRPPDHWEPPPPPPPRDHQPAGYGYGSGYPYLPPPRRRLTWLWVLLAVVGVLVVLGGIGAVWMYQSSRGPIASVDRFLANLHGRRYDAAYRSLCADERATESVAQFQKDALPLVRRMASYDVFFAEPQGNRRQVSYYVTDASGKRIQYEMTVVKEAGAWKVCDFP